MREILFRGKRKDSGERERLIEILREPVPVINGYNAIGVSRMSIVDAEKAADRLLENGVIVPPCSVDTVDNGEFIEAEEKAEARLKERLDVAMVRNKAEQALKGGARDENTLYIT